MEFDAARDALSEARELFESTPGAAPEDLASTIRWLGRIAHQVNESGRADSSGALNEALLVVGLVNGKLPWLGLPLEISKKGVDTSYTLVGPVLGASA